jgi:hypothetical protein
MCARVGNQQSCGVVAARVQTNAVQSLHHQRRDLHQLTYPVLLRRSGLILLSVCLLSSRTEVSLRPMGCNTPLYTRTHPDGDPTPSTLSLLFHSPSILPHKPSTMESSKRVASSGAWDRLPEEFISMITVKVAKTSEALLEEFRSLRLCNKAMKRASLSHGVANRFNLEHHYQSMIWGDVDTCAAYLQTVNWLFGASNRQALFVKGMGNLCTGRPGGAVLLTRAVDEGDL